MTDDLCPILLSFPRTGMHATHLSLFSLSLYDSLPARRYLRITAHLPYRSAEFLLFHDSVYTVMGRLPNTANDEVVVMRMGKYTFTAAALGLVVILLPSLIL